MLLREGLILSPVPFNKSVSNNQVMKDRLFNAGPLVNSVSAAGFLTCCGRRLVVVLGKKCEKSYWVVQSFLCKTLSFANTFDIP